MTAAKVETTNHPAKDGFTRGGLMPDMAGKVERFFVNNAPYITLVHIVMFFGFMALLFLPLFLTEPGGLDGPFDHFTTFANYAIWGLWFPLVFLSVIFTGRSWCGLLCPMGAASEWANKIGPQLSIPGWVKWPGTPVTSFLLVTIWGQTVGVRDYPEAIAIVFGTVLLAALVLGFFFGRQKRAWCRHMCPIGQLLGVYSRIGAVDFKPKRPRKGGDKWTEKTACPTMIQLNSKTESRHCIECFRCVQPKAKGGLFLRFRKPGEEIETIRDHNPNLSEVVFLFTGTGAALGGFLWLALDSYQGLRSWVGNFIIEKGWYWLAEAGPIYLVAAYPERREVLRWLDFFLISGYMLFWTAVLGGVLALAAAAASWLSGRLGGTGNFRQRFIELGYQFTPIAMVSLLLGLGGDLFKNLSYIGLSTDGIALTKAVLFLLSIIWSLWLGDRLLKRQDLSAGRRWVTLIPGVLGSLVVGAAWYPAIF